MNDSVAVLGGCVCSRVVCWIRGVLEIFRQEDTNLSALSEVIDDGQTSSGLPLNRLSGAVGY